MNLDVKSIRSAVIDAAKDIAGKPKESILDNMILNALKKAGSDADEEEIVQIVINMLRSGNESVYIDSVVDHLLTEELSIQDRIELLDNSIGNLEDALFNIRKAVDGTDVEDEIEEYLTPIKNLISNREGGQKVTINTIKSWVREE